MVSLFLSYPSPYQSLVFERAYVQYVNTLSSENAASKQKRSWENHPMR